MSLVLKASCVVSAFSTRFRIRASHDADARSSMSGHCIESAGAASQGMCVCLPAGYEVVFGILRPLSTTWLVSNESASASKC